MDFYPRNNLNGGDFLCFLEQSRKGESWTPIGIGFPILMMDFGRADVTLLLQSFDPAKESTSRQIGGMREYLDVERGIMILIDSLGGNDLALAFADSESAAQFHTFCQRFLKRRELTRQRSYLSSQLSTTCNSDRANEGSRTHILRRLLTHPCSSNRSRSPLSSHCNQPDHFPNCLHGKLPQIWTY